MWYLDWLLIDILVYLSNDIAHSVKEHTNTPPFEMWVNTTHSMEPGPRLNIKTVLSTYGDFHVKNKTVVRTSYL